MSTRPLALFVPRCLLYPLFVLVLLEVVSGLAFCQEAQWGDKKWARKYQAAVECSTCHTRPSNTYRDTGLVLLSEYETWKTKDRHAIASLMLDGPRAKNMGRLLGKDVWARETGCLGCHAPLQVLSAPSARQRLRQDGVSCDVCHGPSKEWFQPHSDLDQSWREWSPEKKGEKGFRDLRDPNVRTQLCASCHIGNTFEGKVLTHAMFAAGHPPLPPFEVATFSANQPPHWRRPEDVPYLRAANQETKRHYHFTPGESSESRLALVGGIVALREFMQQVQDRSLLDEVAKTYAKWPEVGNQQEARAHWPEIAMAHLDCYACHHDLGPKLRQERGFGYLVSSRLIPVTAGRPLVRSWPLTLADVGDSGPSSFLSHVEKLAAACQTKPFGDPKEIRESAAAFRSWCDHALPEIERTKYDKQKLAQILLKVCERFEPDALPDHESARQAAALIKVLYAEWRTLEPPGPRTNSPIPDKLAASLNMKPNARNQKLYSLIDSYVTNVMERPATKDETQLVERSKEIQTMTDTELEEYLKNMASFDPRLFKRDCRELAAFLRSAH
jgi:hypothetical protein